MRIRHTAGQRGKLWTSKIKRTYSAAEPLERRILLSISAASIAGVYTQPGTQWTYNTSDSDGSTSSLSYKVSGPTTFQGQKAYSLGFTGSDGSSDSSYLGFDASGNFVIYGGELSTTDLTDTDVETPPEIVFPASMSAGVPFTTSYQEVDTNDSTANGTTTQTDDYSETITLQSETPAPVTVPAGTFNCYAITITTTDTDETDAGSTPTTDSETIDMAPGVGFVSSSDTDTTAGDGGSVFSGELASFQGVKDHLVFSSQPTDTSIGDNLSPAVTVSVEDANGNVESENNDSISLTLQASKGTGTLGGTATATAVGGVATFSDLSIDSGGQYTLQATDNATESPATSVTSSSFNVSDGKLVFLSSPKGGFAGDALAPKFKVALEDKAGKIITDSKATTVTLAPTGDLADAPISGATASLVRGVATFSSVKLSDPGTYVLSADDDQADVEGDSASFKVAGDHLAFKKEPANSDADSPIPFTVQVEDGKNRPVTDQSGELDFTLTPVADSTDTQLAGDPDQPLADGAYSNQKASSSDALAVDYSGTYTLTVADEGDATDGSITADSINPAAASANAPTPATSKNFKIKGPKLDNIESYIGTQEEAVQNDELTFTDENTASAVQSDGSMSLTGNVLTPDTSKIRQKIKWVVVRNTADIATGADPTVTQDASDPLKATLSLNAEGSFNVICYFDANGNGTFDPGEQLQVLNVAIVGIVVQPTPDPVVTNSTYFGLSTDNGKTFEIGSGDFVSRYAMTASESVQVIGGGADGMLGVSKIHLGWVQNGTSDDVQYGYANGAVYNDGLVTKTKFPILDSSYSAAEVDGNPGALFGTAPGVAITAAPGPTRDPVTGVDPNGGQDRTVGDGDSPGIGYYDVKDGSAIANASGTLGFNDTLTAYSGDYTHDYIGFAQFTWSANYSFIKTEEGWQNGGSTVTASQAQLLEPVTLASLGIKTGPSVYIYSENVAGQHLPA